MRVEVYRNLRSKKYSVRALEGPAKGRVIKHLDSLIIWNPRFVVQPAGNRKVRATGQKNVHAFVRGVWEDNGLGFFPSNPVMYNPYKYTQFMDEQGKAVYTGRIARLDPTGVYYE